jgi:hypothetical protein
LITSDVLLVPLDKGVVTTNGPAVELDVRSTVIEELLFTVKAVETPFKVTEVAPEKFEPVKTTSVEASAPEHTVVGEKLVI